MAVYKIKLKHSSSAAEGVFRWCLDSPKDDFSVSDVRIGEKGIRVRGWVLPTDNAQPSVALMCGNVVKPLPFNESRPDVIERVLKEEAEGHDKLLCGFRHSVTFPDSSFSIGVVSRGKYYPLVEGTIEGAFKVLEGKNNWLFLDNDSNQSVEQYTGNVKLSRFEKSKWKSYFKSLIELSALTKIPTCLLIAPSKENVYSDYYPYSEARSTPIKQLQKIVPKSFNFIFPVMQLSRLPERSFRVCDTHWTVHGAREAAIQLTTTLTGYDKRIRETFKDDEYIKRQAFGDLGRKVYPPRSADEDVLASFNYRDVVVYDNQLPNFGRIITMHNEIALFKQKIILFGSSSAYSMFQYISRLFETVIFVHTAGNVDVELINNIRPDYFCMQTNARFVVRAPTTRESVSKYIREKKASMSGEELKPQFIGDTLPEKLTPLIETLKQL